MPELSKQKARYARENRQRAAKVKAILCSKYGARTEGVATALTDLLTDIRHLCDAETLAFADCDESAYAHYSAEVVQARTGEEQ